MITKDNFKNVLEYLGFSKSKETYSKKFTQFDCELKVDFKDKKLIFPKDLVVHDKTTSNFSSPENFVVFECVYKLLSQGYHPKHIELEKKWQLGHSQKSGKADVYIKDNDGNSLLIIECKTAGSEYKKAINILENDSRNQLFSYLQQATSTKFLALYASDFLDERIVSNYYLVNVSDNEELLQNNPKLKSYKDATTTEEKYQVWCETYDKEYATIGIFENNKSYEIGKTKFTTNDLQDISSKDIQGKYHEFATILRAHNVSGRENAFDKLVNLFLCKVTDEKENPDELKFYWKGKAYDNPFDFQDRLQQLYKIGMDKFLGDEITYIANDKIDEAFDVFKDKPNATKEKIKEFVKQLKFFTNNDFAFIDVHNENLFYQNFDVLLKIAKMIQDIRLTGSEENQFLGDMFESFLDQGVKQSEGQFFTPMPIVKFIINSLPQKSHPKVLDYACGAGHFLNEYAALYEDSQIVGVEKEYRLSKVAKVSSFMYGSDMEIVYSDALAKNERLKNESFDVLIANPPYSVKGFLQTLSEEERENYELIKAVDSKSYSKTGAIECFFIERAKQLLKKDAVVGIIVPSSILNKDTPKLYTKTREIILKHFDIVAIAEFGSGTFGKTGTNTVTLFLKKRGNNPNLALHYTNMVNSWFECDYLSNEAFKESGLLQKYCSHIEIDFEVYKSLLCENTDERIFENETFKEYKTTFEKLSETKQRRAKKTYKALSKEDKEKQEQKKLIKFIKTQEKEKLYYFMLASKQSNDVVIVKSPTTTNETKKFLGYEWGGRKGSEGIKYLSSVSVDIEEDIEEDELDSEDKRVLENLQGLKYINTPLYNPQNSEDASKINKIIKDNFDGIKIQIPDEVKDFVSLTRLVNMMDFSRVDFNKALSLTPVRKIEIESKFPLEKIENLIIENPKSKIKVIDARESQGTYKFFTSGENMYNYNKYLVESKNIYLSTGGNAVVKFYDGKAAYSTDTYSIKTNSLIQIEYLYEFLSSIINVINDNFFKGVGLKHLQKNDLKKLKIPLPPLDIQKEIVKECKIVDSEVSKANETIKIMKKQIENEIKSVSAKKIKLENIALSISTGLTPLRSNSRFWNNGTIPWLRTEQLGAKYIYDTNEKISQIALEETSIKKNPKNTLSIAMYGEGKTRGSISILKEEMTTNQACCNVYLDDDKANYKYVYYYFTTQYENLRNLASGVRHNLNTSHIKNYLIPIPSIETQKQIVSKIEVMESKINKAQKAINGAKEKKEVILKKYL